MPAKPAAEMVIDEELVRGLLADQVDAIMPGTSALPLALVAAGWDSEVWRIGDGLAARLPRRALAAPLIDHEHRALPRLAPRLEAAGVRVPAPLVRGVPTTDFPWSWSVVPWIAGTRGLDVPRAVRTGWAGTLADALAALHAPAPDDHPVNPVRGVPLAARATAFGERLSQVADAGALDGTTIARLAEQWAAGLDAATWDRAPVWIHGDLHPGNLLADAGTLVGIIDFGDVTAGDPAYDLAVAWLAFDDTGRAAFARATDGRYDGDTWIRARAWAAAVAVLLLAHSDDNPDYAALGADAALELADASHY